MQGLRRRMVLGEDCVTYFMSQCEKVVRFVISFGGPLNEVCRRDCGRECGGESSKELESLAAGRRLGEHR